MIPASGRSGRDRLPTPVFLGFPAGSDGKESACNVGDMGLIPGLERSPGELLIGVAWLPTPVFLPGEFHGQRSLVGYSPWDCKESVMTEQLQFHLQNFQSNSIFWNGRTTHVPIGSLEMLELQRWTGQPALPVWSHGRFRFIINTGEVGSGLPAQWSMVTIVLG